ncbi:sugar kinase [Sorangium atrum]|uniref:Sugar kinase n=1 Tax=Sorangium atrum TaxID=2995308 RepID=A0ABT5C5B8_9BACT|nr:sugar kinase [Sorangium aterium]MDC0681616.1 sugar kinase [Sorangium aterium]
MKIRSAKSCAWDQVSLGEVMLRLDPGERRIHTARAFDIGEGGGEYNVARGLRRCFGLRTSIVTALADNPVGRLIEDLMLQGGVDTSHVRWVDYDGVGREARNGLNFTERGFGPRAAVGCSDRGHSAASRLKTGDLPWKALFGERGARWFHTGGIFCALSETTAGVAREAMEAAREHDVRISYDLNYRPSLWKNFGGQARAREVNRALMPYVDCLFGNEEDFVAALGFEVPGVDEGYRDLDTAGFRRMISEVVATYPNISVVATSLRTARSASVNGWGGILYCKGEFHEVAQRDIEILDRVGGGDSFASGIIYGLLSEQSPEWALQCGVAHGALAMSTPGDTSMASLAEVRRAMSGASARIER